MSRLIHELKPNACFSLSYQRIILGSWTFSLFVIVFNGCLVACTTNFVKRNCTCMYNDVTKMSSANPNFQTNTKRCSIPTKNHQKKRLYENYEDVNFENLCIMNYTCIDRKKSNLHHRHSEITHDLLFVEHLKTQCCSWT